jgi:hypothetical protein
MRPDRLGDPRPAGGPADNPGRAVPVELPPAGGQEDRAFAALADRQVDRPGGGRGKRDGDNFPPLRVRTWKRRSWCCWHQAAYWHRRSSMFHGPAADAGTFAASRRRSLTPLPDGLAEAYGRARLYRVGLVVFVAASIPGGLAVGVMPVRLRRARLASFLPGRLVVPGPYMYKPPLTG